MDKICSCSDFRAQKHLPLFFYQKKKKGTSNFQNEYMSKTHTHTTCIYQYAQFNGLAKSVVCNK